VKLQFFLYVIILGLVINLVADKIWKYIPRTNRYLDKIVTGVLVSICVLLLIFYKEEDRGSESSQQRIEVGAHSSGVHSNIGGTQIIATHSHVTVGPAVNDLPSKPCTVEAKIISDVVSRVFIRDAFSCEGEGQILYPASQELFYEWQVQLSVNDNARDISLELINFRARTGLQSIQLLSGYFLSRWANGILASQNLIGPSLISYYAQSVSPISLPPCQLRQWQFVGSCRSL
jgi:hypothetical protein